ncbi:MAG: hypothetical protein ACI8QS_003169 [Planctomycetota bacterium]
MNDESAPIIVPAIFGTYAMQTNKEGRFRASFPYISGYEGIPQEVVLLKRGKVLEHVIQLVPTI